MLNSVSYLIVFVSLIRLQNTQHVELSYDISSCLFLSSLAIFIQYLQEQQTPLDLAVEINDTAAMTFLLSVGADVDLLDQVSIHKE